MNLSEIKVTVGADPEVFVTQGEDIISVEGLLGGTKDKPIPVNKGALQEDNVLAEFNIDPANTEEEFCFNIKTVMEALGERLGDTKGIMIKPSHTFKEEQLTTEQALTFGCDPDLNAWTQEWNEVPDSSSTVRTAGGHVHIGYDNPDVEMSFCLVRLCDYLLGLPSVILDQDAQRRSLYGKAGACRIKAYGVEYRALSNFWLMNDTYQKWVFSVAKNVVTNLPNLQRFIDTVPPNVVQQIINEGDVLAAESAVSLLDIFVPETTTK